MATHKFTLTHGLTVGKETLKSCVMRELITGDIIEAQLESEQLMMVKDGDKRIPTLISSPAAMGFNALCRQIISIGDLDGPFELADLKKLHPDDFHHIQLVAEMLDGVMTVEEVVKELASRGRSDGVGGATGVHPDGSDAAGAEA